MSININFFLRLYIYVCVWLFSDQQGELLFLRPGSFFRSGLDQGKRLYIRDRMPQVVVVIDIHRIIGSALL